jgi:hypothetical protein
MGLGTGIAGAGLVSTGALTDVSADRGVSVATADGETALLGLVDQGPVKKNSREEMVELTNNTDDDLTITVSLSNCNDGTLYDNEGGQADCQNPNLTFTLGSGNTQLVDIEASTTGTIGYSVTATGPGLSIETSANVESQAGNVQGAIRIKKPKQNDFTASTGNGNGNNSGGFTVDKVDIVDNDDDTDLDEVRFRVREGGSSGELVGSRDVTPPVAQYDENNVDVPVDSDYTITAGTTYALTVTAEDADGNVESETVEDTA